MSTSEESLWCSRYPVDRNPLEGLLNVSVLWAPSCLKLDLLCNSFFFWITAITSVDRTHSVCTTSFENTTWGHGEGQGTKPEEIGLSLVQAVDLHVG